MYMATLFHDIGYPVEHYVNTHTRVLEYLPVLSTIYSINPASLDTLSILLSRSLLFDQVKREEIQKRLTANDHGAISAFVFLLYFYQNSLIDTLPPYKQAAVELAALAMYNHTLQYFNATDDKYENHYHLSFTQDPISFILRICDDIQDWDRVYFDIVPSGFNMQICDKCRTPILRRHVRGEIVTNCGCSGGKMNQLWLQRVNCVYLAKMVHSLHFNYEKEQDRLSIIMGYEPYNMLEMSLIHPGQVKWRAKGINKLRKMLDMNDMFPKTFVWGWATENPILLKVMCIYSLFYNIQQFACLGGFANEINEIIANATISEAIREKLDRLRKDINYYKDTLINVNEGSLTNARINALWKELMKALGDMEYLILSIDLPEKCPNTLEDCIRHIESWFSRRKPFIAYLAGIKKYSKDDTSALEFIKEMKKVFTQDAVTGGYGISGIIDNTQAIQRLNAIIQERQNNTVILQNLTKSFYKQTISYSEILQSVQSNLNFYLSIYTFWQVLESLAREENQKEKIKELYESYKQTAFINNKKFLLTDAAQYLFKDCIDQIYKLTYSQASLMVGNHSFAPNEYYELFEGMNKDYHETAISRFNDPDEPNGVINHDRLNAFTDLYFFQSISVGFA